MDRKKGEMDKLIIIGGGFSGKLVAIAAAQFVKEVIVVEKKEIVNGNTSIDVEQKDHVHILLKRGLNELVKLCPDIKERLRSKGAVEYDMKKNFHWWHYGGEKIRVDSDFFILQQSRKLLEDVLMEYVNESPNITYYCKTKFIEFLTPKSNLEQKIKGITVQKDNKRFDLSADAFVLACGSPEITHKLFSKKTPIVCKKINLCYYSRNYKMIDSVDWFGCASSPLFPNQTQGGVILKTENPEEYIVTLSAYNHKQSGENRIYSILEELPNKKIKEFIEKATPMTEWQVFSIR